MILNSGIGTKFGTALTGYSLVVFNFGYMTNVVLFSRFTFFFKFDDNNGIGKSFRLLQKVSNKCFLCVEFYFFLW